MIDEKLLENLEDAQMALLMDAYAKAEGEALMAESELLEEPMSEKFKAQCLGLIDREFVKRRRKKRYQAAARNTAKAALVAFALVGLLSLGVMSVEAIRVPVLNFFLEYKEKFTTIFFTPTAPEGTLQGGMVQEGPLAGLLPDTYKMDSLIELEDCILALYSTDTGNYVSFSASQWDGLRLNVDTENAELYEERLLLEYNAYIVVKGYTQILWINENSGTVYEVLGEMESQDTLWELAAKIAANKR